MHEIINTIVKSKFNAQKSYMFDNKGYFYHSCEEFLKEYDSIPENSFCCILTHHKTEINLNNCLLVECIGFDTNDIVITLIKKQNHHIQLENLNSQSSVITDFSVSLVCTQDDLYLNFLEKAVSHYKKEFTNVEICVAYFGEIIPKFLDGCIVAKYEDSQFGMSFAKNRSVELSTKKHTLRMDLDCLLTHLNFIELKDKWINLNHNGIINLKRPQNPYPGNGLWFGETDKFKQIKFDERFQKFWFEDTEYLMNFSRQGIIPYTFFIVFKYNHAHSRVDTDPSGAIWKKNEILFEQILKQGHR